MSIECWHHCTAHVHKVFLNRIEKIIGSKRLHGHSFPLHQIRKGVNQTFQSDGNFIRIELSRIDEGVYMKAFQSTTTTTTIIGLFGCV